MQICTKCLLPETYPNINFDETGTCSHCIEDKGPMAENADFASEDELIRAFSGIKAMKAPYDAVVALSGGVDSTYALINLVTKYGLRVLGYHNDHGFEDSIATLNVKNLCEKLDVDLIIAQKDVTFMKKLWKYVAEGDVPGLTLCYVCGNILYLNALEIADKFQAPMLINGYSKGQVSMVENKEESIVFFQQLLKLIENTGDRPFIELFHSKYELLSKRKSYSAKEDLLNHTRDQILVVPFFAYQFYKTDKQELRKYVESFYDWRPLKFSYPSRTTNCDMAWLNSYVDIQKRGYTSYHIEYAELIRRGEITREQAIADLEFHAPDGMVKRLANEIELDLGCLSFNRQ